MAFDFTEIGSAQGGKATQEQFELFAREFLERRGYRIINGPGRGADGGADLIVEREPLDGEENRPIRYLVSCKHYAHASKPRSVTPSDESNIGDRLVRHKCDGFIAFYSGSLSQALSDNLHAYKELGRLIEIYDSARLELELTENESCHPIARSFLPKSFNAWVQSDPLYPDKARNAIANLYASQAEFNITAYHTEDSVVNLVTARTNEEPGPTILTAQLKFHQEEDRDAFEAYQRWIEGGHPIEIAPQYIESLDYNETLLRLFPDYALDKNHPLTFIPVMIQGVEKLNLVIVMPDATEFRYWTTLEFDQIRGGLKERLISNRRQPIPLTIELIVAPPKVSISIAVRYEGLLSKTAFRICNFLAQLVLGAKIELRDPINDTVVYTITIDSDAPYGQEIPLYERLARIEAKTGVELIVPKDGFDKETLRRVLSVSQLVNGDHIEVQETSVTMASKDIAGGRSNILDSDERPAFFFMSVDNEVVVDILGKEISLGPILTVGWIVRQKGEATKITSEDAQGDRDWRAVKLEPLEKGFIYKYAIQYCSKGSFDALREKILPGAWEQLSEIDAVTHLIDK